MMTSRPTHTVRAYETEEPLSSQADKGEMLSPLPLHALRV